jgi:hypothetical protein
LKAIVRKVRALTGEIFYPKPDRLPSAAHFQDGVPNYEAPSPMHHVRPQFPDDHPHFPGDAPQCKSSRPHFFGWPSPISRPFSPIFPRSLPIFPRVFPNFPATFPNFSPADLIYNGLFPAIYAKTQGRGALRRQKPSLSPISGPFSNSKLKIKH